MRTGKLVLFLPFASSWVPAEPAPVGCGPRLQGTSGGCCRGRAWRARSRRAPASTAWPASRASRGRCASQERAAIKEGLAEWQARRPDSAPAPRWPTRSPWWGGTRAAHACGCVAACPGAVPGRAARVTVPHVGLPVTGQAGEPGGVAGVRHHPSAYHFLVTGEGLARAAHALHVLAVCGGTSPAAVWGRAARRALRPCAGQPLLLRGPRHRAGRHGHVRLDHVPERVRRPRAPPAPGRARPPLQPPSCSRATPLKAMGDAGAAFVETS